MPVPTPDSLQLGACSDRGQKLSRSWGVCCGLWLLLAITAGVADSVLLWASVQKAAPARCLKVCSQRRAWGCSVCGAELPPWGCKEAPCWWYWLAKSPEPSLPPWCHLCGSCWDPPWGLFQQICSSRGRGNSSGAACGVLASGEVSAAYIVLNFVLGNGGSLIASRCIFVSL